MRCLSPGARSCYSKNAVDLNLDTLKQEILGHLEHSEFAVFRTESGSMDNLPTVLWDVERYPDYQMFLETARKSGANMILFASREFTEAELDELPAQLEDLDLPREERREFERQIKNFRVHQGATCEIEIAFQHQSFLYLYSAQPDWYEEFQDLSDEVAIQLPISESGEEDPGMGGFYSNN